MFPLWKIIVFVTNNGLSLKPGQNFRFLLAPHLKNTSLCVCVRNPPKKPLYLFTIFSFFSWPSGRHKNFDIFFYITFSPALSTKITLWPLRVVRFLSLFWPTFHSCCFTREHFSAPRSHLLILCYFERLRKRKSECNQSRNECVTAIAPKCWGLLKSDAHLKFWLASDRRSLWQREPVWGQSPRVSQKLKIERRKLIGIPNSWVWWGAYRF